MWREQVQLGVVPYYMFVERDTGPRHYFEVPLARGLRIFNRAYAEADVKIVVGTIEPHQFAGFSGGVKTAAIGLAGKRTAIGDAIGLAVKRLREQPQGNRVLILLTDGANGIPADHFVRAIVEALDAPPPTTQGGASTAERSEALASKRSAWPPFTRCARCWAPHSTWMKSSTRSWMP